MTFWFDFQTPVGQTNEVVIHGYLLAQNCLPYADKVLLIS